MRGNYQRACLHTHAHTRPCVCCARVLRLHRFASNELSGCSRLGVRSDTEHQLARVCTHSRPSSFAQPPPAKQKHAVPNRFFLFSVPSTRGHALNQGPRLGLTQKGHVNLSRQAVQTWTSRGFHRNDGLLFLGPRHSFFVQWSSYE